VSSWLSSIRGARGFEEDDEHWLRLVAPALWVALRLPSGHERIVPMLCQCP
jgi:hypothetical protein